MSPLRCSSHGSARHGVHVSDFVIVNFTYESRLSYSSPTPNMRLAWIIV